MSNVTQKICGGSSYVYFLGAKDEAVTAVKVGISKDPISRLAILQVGCPFELNLIALIRTPYARQVERYIKENCACKQYHGEWFSPEKLATTLRGGNMNLLAALVDQYFAPKKDHPFDELWDK